MERGRLHHDGPERGDSSAPSPAQVAYNPTGAWTNVAVRVLLRSPRNMAKSTLYDEIMGDGVWSPTVDEATWRAVDRLLSDRERPWSPWGRLANLLSGIALCSVCDGTMAASRRRADGESVYLCKGRSDRPDLGRAHASIAVDFADGQIVWRMVRQMEATRRVSFRPLPVSVDTEPLVRREREIQQLMAELVEDRAAGLIDRAAMVAGTAKLRAELAEVQAEIARAGKVGGPVTEIDIEAAYDEFDRLDLGEQREIIRSAFAFLKVVPRGKGRPRKGEPLERAECLLTDFTPEWS